ncbi:MAG: hypothetical protein HC771_10010 [Synechococcales cyanobacterium CRU_2_2]|nr:hypothetical protein [Synechococcales cyanobacterium CRU_2_2]
MHPDDQITALKQAIAQQFGWLDRDRTRLEKQLRAATHRIAVLGAENRALKLRVALLLVTLVVTIAVLAGWRSPK